MKANVVSLVARGLVGRRISLLRVNTIQFLCGDGTILYLTVVMYTQIYTCEFHGTIQRHTQNKLVHVKLIKIYVRSAFK